MRNRHLTGKKDSTFLCWELADSWIIFKQGLIAQDRRQNGKLLWLEQLEHEKLDNVFLTFYDVFDEKGTYNARRHHFVGFVGEGEVGCVMK